MYFVWINGLRDPEAQIWTTDLVDGAGKSKPVLFKKRLSIIDQLLSLNRLMEKYPLCPT